MRTHENPHQASSSRPEGHQLRSYIAPGTPATRTPCDGREPDMRIEFGFTPRWYHEHCGIDFSERWHLDPVYRGQSVTAMRRVLAQRFPRLFPGEDAWAIAPVNLDGVHGAMTMALIFGIPVEYYEDNWPAARHEYLPVEQLRGLEVPDLASCPVIEQILGQMDIIERESGRIDGYLNWQGVLNNAYRLRGPEILTDIMTDPPFAHHLFDVLARTAIAGMRLIYARQRETGVDIRHATVSNCLVNMVSPEVYGEFLLPCDQMIADAFEAFGVHNCAWNVDPYVEDYATIRTGGGRAPLGYVDMGIESDLARVRCLCPDTRRAIMYTPKDLTNKELEELRRDLERIRRELSPCDIVMADIDYDTPDERVTAFAALAEETLAIPPATNGES